MNNTNIIFATRSDYLTRRGGDTTQLLMTKKYLDELYNCNVKIITDVNQLSFFPENSIVHVFNLQTEKLTLEYVLAAKSQNKKVALSTIYWDLLYSYIVETLFSKTGTIQLAKQFSAIVSFFAPVINKLPGERYLRREYIAIRKLIIDNSDVLLPNSDEELGIIEKEFKYENLKNKSHIVPNAVVLDHKSPINSAIKRGILIVGRVEPNKNQLNLIRALKKSKLSSEPIYVIGRIGDVNYFEMLKKESASLPHIKYIEELPYEDLIEFYKKCKVHVLPSFRESPGLVSLEALYYGCNIVISGESYCPVKYYEFSKYGFLCDPNSTNSIKSAMEKAYESSIIVPLEYFEKFSFRNVAVETYNAYEKIR
ncbi:glycosyltransferase family 4 protein [Aeromonas veronii]|uniref:glycosyltransferase family 4 protein n=1 Tax=Aeromonas veronii TaxID=654 RepID=UPI003D245DF5